MILLFQLLCIALIYSAFCRAVHLSPEAMLRIRWAVTAIGATAMYALYLSLMTPWRPDWIHVLLLAVFWLYVSAFASTWPPGGTPAHVYKKKVKPLVPDHIL